MKWTLVFVFKLSFSFVQMWASDGRLWNKWQGFDVNITDVLLFILFIWVQTNQKSFQKLPCFIVEVTKFCWLETKTTIVIRIILLRSAFLVREMCDLGWQVQDRLSNWTAITKGQVPFARNGIETGLHRLNPVTNVSNLSQQKKKKKKKNSPQIN